MRSTLTSLLAGLALLVSMSACDSFVGNTDPFISLADSDSLDSQSQVPFLVNGVLDQFASSYDQLAVASDLLSDAFLFNTNVNGATFPTYGDLDRAQINLDNNTVRGSYNATNGYRFAADNLVDRALNRITFTQDDAGNESRRLALFTGYLHAGIARHFLASYFGPSETVGGAPISPDRNNPGPVIPSAELYAQAIAQYTSALEHVGAGATGAYNTRLLNTLIARAHLYRGERVQAGDFASRGLVQGDAPFRALYAPTSTNEWWANGGIGRTQTHAADRFFAYQQEGDTRVVVERAPPITSAPNFVAYRQALYPTNASPINHVTWQEASLIQAEAALFGAGGAVAALPFLNAVRPAGLPPVLVATEAALLEERDRQFFTQGVRLIDQRRFNVFHTQTIDNTGPVAVGAWRFLPIPTDERDANPNV